LSEKEKGGQFVPVNKEKWTHLRKFLNPEIESEWRAQEKWLKEGCFYCRATTLRIYFERETVDYVREDGKRVMKQKYKCLVCGAQYDRLVAK
jgi:hypothetical protein